MKNKRCNKWYILIACIGISLIVIYFIRNENEKRVTTAMFVEIEDNNKNPVYYKEIAKNNIELNLTLQYSSNKEQEIQVYLLHNFSLTSFSINGKESMRHSMNITPSKYLKSSKDNVLTLSDVSFDKNEFCLLIIGETHITTKRFQIDNVNGEKNREKMKEVNNELLYPKLYKRDLIDLPIYTTNEIPQKSRGDGTSGSVFLEKYRKNNGNMILLNKKVRIQQGLEGIKNMGKEKIEPSVPSPWLRRAMEC